MGSPNPENSSKLDLNDSGCVQDASVSENGYRGSAQLLDLSDDVLLCILQYCTPRDLKALGHTCPRLGTLICDRTLWTQVDHRTSPVGQQRLRWLLTHCLSPATTELKLHGYANKFSRCLGIQDLHWPDESDSGYMRTCAGTAEGVDVEHFLLRMWYPHLPRFAVSPRWPDKKEAESKQHIAPEATEAPYPKKGESSNSGDKSGKAERLYFPSMFDDDIEEDCKGPQFTFSVSLMRELRKTCTNLTSLALEYCNIDYKTTSIRQFPRHLKKLSLRGSRCYNLPLNTSYLGKVQDRLPELEYLDVSECDWFEPASLMPLSKLAGLTELYMRDCKRLTECVAYASLATRYGFRKLRVFDVRGSPLADSEVSALGWLPNLQELYVAPPEEFNSLSEHTHTWNDTKVTFNELDSWEEEEPEYYKGRSPEPSELDEDDDLRDEEASEAQDRQDMVLSNPWWSRHERRIIVIQPNANRQAEAIAIRQPEAIAIRQPEAIAIRQPEAIAIRQPEVIAIRERQRPDPAELQAGDPQFRPCPCRPDAVPNNPPLEPRDPPQEPQPGTNNSEPRNLLSGSKNQSTPKKIQTGPCDAQPESNNPPEPQKSQPGPKDPQPGPAEPGPSKRSANVDDAIDLAKRPRIEDDDDDDDDIGDEEMPFPEPMIHIVPNVSAEQCPRLRDRGLDAPGNRPGYVQFRRNDMHPVMHIDVDIQRQSSVHISTHAGYLLVTDSALLRFGRAENENINYVHIGRNGIHGDTNSRPDRSNLRILSVTGYRNISDRSLEHLATAAPHLLHIDFTETSVTARGVEVFKAIRPNCDVLFSQFGKMT